MDDNTVQPVADNDSLCNPDLGAPNQPRNNSKGIIAFIIICALIALGGMGFGFYTMIDNNNKAQRIAELEAGNAKSEVPTEPIDDDDPSIDLEKITNDYGRVVNSASSEYRAKTAAEFTFLGDEYNTVTSTEIIEENDYYYGVHVAWEHNEDGSQYEENVISFKEDVYEYEYSYIPGDDFKLTRETRIDNNKFNQIDRKTIKTVLDIASLVGKGQNKSFEWVGSELKEDGDSFVYTAHYNETAYGDFGVDDETTEKGYTIKVDKKTGELTGVSEYGDDEDYEDDE